MTIKASWLSGVLLCFKTDMKKYEKTFQKVAMVVLAFFATLCTPDVVKDDLVKFSLSNSVFSILIFIGYFILLQSAMKHADKPKIVFASVLGFVFSAFMIMGKNICISGKTYILELNTWKTIFAMFPIFSALMVLCFQYFPWLHSQTISQDKKLSDTKRFFLVWLLIFFAWIPVLLASYPGVYGYDSVFQINYYRSGRFSLHHPIAHSYLLGFFIVTLGDLLGSNEAGMCCYSVFQMLCLSATLAALYSVYISKRCNKVVSFGILLLLMFLPTNAIMAMSATKDIFFSAFIALATMLLLLVAEKPERLRSVKFDVALTAVFLALSIFRNQGKYVIIVCFAVAFPFLWKYKKQLLIILVSSMVLLGIYNGPITTALGGVPAEPIKEMMSVPCTQLACAHNDYADQLTEEEIQSIKGYIAKYWAYDRYSGIADAFKGSLNVEKLKEDPLDFIRLWISVGLKCPTAYVDAFAKLTVGYWYPDMNYRNPKAFHPYWEYLPSGVLDKLDPDKYLLLDQTPVKGFEDLHTWLYELTYKNDYQSQPIISMLFSSALPVWCILIALAYVLYKRLYRYLIPLAFLLMLLVTLLLGPVVLYRYVYPLQLAAPLVLCCGANQYTYEKEEK